MGLYEDGRQARRAASAASPRAFGAVALRVAGADRRRGRSRRGGDAGTREYSACFLHIHIHTEHRCLIRVVSAKDDSRTFLDDVPARAYTCVCFLVAFVVVMLDAMALDSVVA